MKYMLFILKYSVKYYTNFLLKMLITLLAIAAELHLLFSNKRTIHINYEDLDNLFNRICSEKR